MNENIYQDYIQSITTADTAHDVLHVQRVVANAKKIAVAEQADLDIIVAAAWLHDCVAVAKDSPYRSQASRMAAEQAAGFLASINMDDGFIQAVCHAIEAHSFSANITPKTIEAKVVQDADRLDALGAVGIARCFAVNGALNRSLYSQDDPLCQIRDPDDQRFGIDHFFSKLFLLKDLFNTNAAKIEAGKRMEYMQGFLEQFYIEITPTENE